MTEFETQVAAALTKAMFDAQDAGGKPLWPETMMPHLAPRVAAAITVVAQEVVKHLPLEGRPDAMRLLRELSVGALRGETP